MTGPTEYMKEIGKGSLIEMFSHLYKKNRQMKMLRSLAPMRSRSSRNPGGGVTRTWVGPVKPKLSWAKGLERWFLFIIILKGKVLYVCQFLKELVISLILGSNLI